METTTPATQTPQQLYVDSPTSSRSSSPAPTQTHTSASSTSSATVKPLPALPTYTDEEPYRDDPTEPTEAASHAQRHRSQSPQQQPQRPRHEHRYADNPPPLSPHISDENIPLAHFLPHPQYPLDAPPSYSVAVRQTHSYQDTLIQYIPNNQNTPHHDSWPTSATRYIRPVLIEIDEETGEVVSRTDDVRYSVEKVVAMFVVAIVLLVLSGVLGWLALGY